jgi:hypothetical protein
MTDSQLELYRGCLPVVDAQYEPGSPETPTAAIVQTLATAADTDPTEVAPLYEAIDTDALDRLFANHSGDAAADAVLSFTVETWNVFVRADGSIRICDATRPTDPMPVFEGQPA